MGWLFNYMRRPDWDDGPVETLIALYFAAQVNIGIVTLLYALMAFCVYATLYGRKHNPLETHADRMHTIGSVSLVTSALLCFMCLKASPHRPGANGLGSSPAPTC